MTIRFAVDQWAGWAPGLTDAASWKTWLRAPYPLPAGEKPALTEMAPMSRRRVERLGRVALQAAFWCQSAPRGPVVFASRYGDITRSVELLLSLAEAAPLSPAAFSLSVHNAIGALYSIALGDTAPYSAVAAGDETVEAAFVEAAGLLSDGVPSVMVVYYEEPLCPPYDRFDSEPAFPRAWACAISAAATGGLSLSSGEPSLPSLTHLPADLAILDFLISDAPCFDRATASRHWRWSRHA